MSEESRKTDNKILSFHIAEEDIQDPELDRFVRESLIREADEIEAELNRKPELKDIEAPEGMFESIVEELKARGVWEEEPEDGAKSAEAGQAGAAELAEVERTTDPEVRMTPGQEGSIVATAYKQEEGPTAEFETAPGQNPDMAQAQSELEALYARLPEADQQALALGRELVQKQEAKAGKRRRRRKILRISGIVAACLVLVFGISMTSDANRRLVKKMWDGLMENFAFRMSTNYLGEGESIRSKSKEEAEALEKISEQLGSPAIDLMYLPEGMEYQGFEIKDDLNAVLFYLYQETFFYITVLDADQEGSYYYMYDNDAVFREHLTNKAGIEADIWEVNLDEEEETYIAELEYEGWRYILNGMISLEEMREIMKYTFFL